MNKSREAENRRQYILKKLESEAVPVTAMKFAGELGVSRQVIVGDVAILRASGTDIVSTARGYVLASGEESFPNVVRLACMHDAEGMRDELNIIVDHGATVIDVSVDHAIYGELMGKLNLSSRYDVEQFIRIVEEENNSAPISSLTGGLHFHRIGCRSMEMIELIKKELNSRGFLVEKY